MGDGITFTVSDSYRSFNRRWQRAMLGTFYWRTVIRVHRWFGVRVRSKPRLIGIVHGAPPRRAFLNPLQIVYTMEAE
jgi:hypothetical protein